MGLDCFNPITQWLRIGLGPHIKGIVQARAEGASIAAGERALGAWGE